jgi:WD40 repeat protein
MDAERAIAIINTVLAPKSLKLVQMQIIRGVLAGNSYQQIAATGPNSAPVPPQADATAGGKTVGAASPLEHRSRSDVYQIGYVRETAARLWQSLGERLGQRVSKKSLAAVLLWYSMQSGIDLNEESISATAATKSERQRSSKDWRSIERHPVGDLETEPHFYGRTEEIATLTDWCLYQRCRLIFTIGMGGMGKTTLVREVAHQLECYFDLTLWRSLLNLPPLTELCADLLQFLNPQSLVALPSSEDGQIDLLIACLKRDRCLLIVDNVESILEGQVQSGQYLPGYEGYDRLFRALGELPHQSCAILTSREKPHSIARAQIINPQLVRSMTIDGLSSAAGHQLIQAYGCPPIPAQMWQEIHAHYGGNPLALKIAAIAAVEITGGGEKVLELYPLMKQGQLQFRSIDDVLYRQFERLSEIEQQLVYWLAIEREPIAGTALRANLVLHTRAPGDILNALQSLARRCITTCQEQTWSIQPVMVTYVTNRSIDLFSAELAPHSSVDRSTPDLQQRFCHLNTYAIIQATAKDYLRQTQIQSILRPILERSLQLWGNRDALSQHLRQILHQWRTLDPIPSGYLAGNILNLLSELAPERCLQDLECSQLPIRSAYLADVKLDRVNFAAAAFDRCVFTQAFGGIVFAIYHPDGELIATGDANGDISLWQTSDGQRVAIYPGHTNWTRALAFSADGKLLASSSEDCTFRLWDTRSGEQVAMFGPHTHPLRGMAFSRDGQKLTICSDDGLIRIYNLPNLLADPATLTVESHCIQSLEGHSNWVFSVNYSPDESRLASASADGTVRIWEVATGECVQILRHEHWVIRTLFSRDGRYLIVSGMSATIYIWDTVDGQMVQTLTGHLDWVWSIAISADGNTLISTGEDLTIKIWDLPTGSCHTIFHAHQDRIWTVALSPDGRHFVSGSEDRTIKIWDLPRGKCLKTINGYGNWIKSIAFIPQQNWLASGHRDAQIRLWDLQNRTCIQTLSGHTDAVLAIAISPDGRYLASSSLDRTIRIWDLQGLAWMQTLHQHSSDPNDPPVAGSYVLVFSPDGRQIITGNDRAELQIWDVATGKLDRTLSGHHHRIQAVAICQVQQLLVTACEHQIRLWDLHTNECLQTIVAHYLPVICVAFSSDGRYLATGSMDKTVKVWDTSNWECLHTLTGHRSLTLTVAFSPTPVRSGSTNDYQLIVGSGDRRMTRWNITTGERLQTYTGHTNWVWSIAYSPDGGQIASAGEDETIKIWNVEQSQAIHTLRLKRPYEDTNITGATGLRLGQRHTLKRLGAIDD